MQRSVWQRLRKTPHSICTQGVYITEPLVPTRPFSETFTSRRIDCFLTNQPATEPAEGERGRKYQRTGDAEDTTEDASCVGDARYSDEAHASADTAVELSPGNTLYQYFRNNLYVFLLLLQTHAIEVNRLKCRPWKKHCKKNTVLSLQWLNDGKFGRCISNWFQCKSTCQSVN